MTRVAAIGHFTRWVERVAAARRANISGIVRPCWPEVDYPEDRLLTITEAAGLFRAPVATRRYWRYDILAWLHEQSEDSATT